MCGICGSICHAVVMSFELLEQGEGDESHKLHLLLVCIHVRSFSHFVIFVALLKWNLVEFDLDGQFYRWKLGFVS